MKRKALIIGNSGDKNNRKEYLEGVNKDVKNYNNFLQSNIGGAWDSNEIVVSLDETKDQLLKKISQIKEESNDFIFVIFSGHGGYSLYKECRKLYIYDKNSSIYDNYDFIYEEDLLYMADKQITIMDTCADVEDDLLKESMTMDSMIAHESYSNDRFYYRIQYENVIKQSPRQQVVLYSSSINESSNDDSELGGYFAYNLLKVAKRNKNSILSSKEAYFKAKDIVQAKTNNEQNPQCRCIKSEKSLPFSIKE